jgi:hypothetical protein
MSYFARLKLTLGAKRKQSISAGNGCGNITKIKIYFKKEVKEYG